MDTGTILTILFLVLYLALSAVNRLLKKAAGDIRKKTYNGGTGDSSCPGSGDDPDFRETPAEPVHGRGLPLEGPWTVQQDPRTVQPEPVAREAAAFSVPQDLLDGGYKSVKDILEERRKSSRPAVEDTPSRRFVIDKRNLVIYPEIMKPKF